ncbi:MAG: antibiotic biosynthesis monooxygenase family protein [Myxococcota bacterium]
MTPKEGRVDPMATAVLEMALLDVRPEAAAEFESAFDEARSILAAARGYRRHELRRCEETAARYLLLVWWDSLEDHTEGFRGSPDYARWSALLHRFYDPFPSVLHFGPTLVEAP